MDPTPRRPSVGPALIAMAAVGVASRLAAASSWLGDWDAVDFALALTDYDLARYQPHFPGYPLYVAAAWLARQLGAGPVEALVLPGVVAGGLAVVPFFALADSLFGRRAAFWAAGLFLVNPAAWLACGRVGSDGLGLFFLVAAALALRRADASPTGRRRAAAGALVGLALGVRLTLVPLLAPTVFVLRRPGRGRLAGALSLVGGVALWLVPQAALVGPGRLVDLGLDFTAGHFGDWGGAVTTGGGLGSRVGDLLAIVGSGLGAWSPGGPALRLASSAVLAVGLAGAVRGARRDRAHRDLVLILALLGGWVFLVQNLSRPRHALPIVPWLLIAVARGLDVWTARWRGPVVLAAAVVALGPLAVDGWGWARRQATVAPPAVRLVEAVARRPDARRLRVYGWETRRLFAWYAPEVDARRSRDLADLDHDLAGSWVAPATVLVTSKVEGAPGRSGRWTVVGRFRSDPLLDAPYDDLVLYSYEPTGDR